MVFTKKRFLSEIKNIFLSAFFIVDNNLWILQILSSDQFNKQLSIIINKMRHWAQRHSA